MLERISDNLRFQLLGEVVAVMMNSPLHSKYAISDVINNFLPPLDLGQFRIYKKNNKPVALLTWAYLSEEIENKYMNEQYDLKLEDWNSGDRLWFIDFMAPFGGVEDIKKDIKSNVFPNGVAKALRADESGKIKDVVEYYGVNYKKE